MILPYPLAWPERIPRWEGARETGKFKTSLSSAMNNVQTSLRLFAADSAMPVDSVVITSNFALGAEKPTDPGVAIWMDWHGMTSCIPVDRYTKVEANLQAIHHIIEARRTELRHGTLALVRASFEGFKALPPPNQNRPWYTVLGLTSTASLAEAEAAYKYLVRKTPEDQRYDLNDAIATARKVMK